MVNFVYRQMKGGGPEVLVELENYPFSSVTYFWGETGGGIGLYITIV